MDEPGGLDARPHGAAEAPDASPFRWGVLSTANIAVEKVIPGMRRARGSEVLAIGSRDEDRGRAVASVLGIPRAYGSYEALLADPDIDAVYIPLPNHLHARWTVEAARAGKHVLCEKPLALTAAEAQGMVDACRGAGVLLMEAFMYRLHPSWVAVRELIEAGRIGRLTAVDSWFSYFNDDPHNIRNIRDAGGGALYDIGCYNINLSRMLFGSEPLRVEASVTRDPGSGVDVLTSGLLTFPGGVATFTCSTRVEPDQRVDIYGTAGRISIPIPFNIPPDRPDPGARDRRRRSPGCPGHRGHHHRGRGPVRRRGRPLRRRGARGRPRAGAARGRGCEPDGDRARVQGR